MFVFFACTYGNHWQSIWKYNRNSTGANFHHNRNQELHDPKITVHRFLLRLVEPCHACRRGWARLAPNIGKTKPCGLSTKNLAEKGTVKRPRFAGTWGCDLRCYFESWFSLMVHGWESTFEMVWNWWTDERVSTIVLHCSVFCRMFADIFQSPEGYPVVAFKRVDLLCCHSVTY